MTEASRMPGLTPQFCFSAEALRDFLRLSRSSVDDSITQNLNAIDTPASVTFDPLSTSHRTFSSVRKQLDPKSCQGFKDTILFPSWEARSSVLAYCGIVAASPDPSDPDASRIEAERRRDKERVVNERLDPYSGRFFPKEPRTEQLANLIRQESSIENIVRSRTWATIQQRCGTSANTWQEALDRWRVAGRSK